MNKVLMVAVGALALAGCTAREQQIATAGVAGAVIGSALTAPAPQPRPYYVQEPRYVVVPPRRPRCFITWENTHRGYVERRVCDRY